MTDCPHKRSMSEEQNITLFTGSSDNEMCLFTSEARNVAVLDSGCTSTVTGQLWLKFYLETLHPDQVNMVKYHDSTRVFKFGGGETKISQGCVVIPCKLAGISIMVRTDIS